LLALGGATLIGLACDVVALEDGGGSGEVPPEVQAAFDGSCAFPGCHGGGSPAGGLSLEEGQSDAAIGGGTSNSTLPLIEIGNIDGSYLAQKMLPEESRADGVSISGGQMPPGGGDTTNVAIILAWIAGANVDGAGSSGEDESTGGDGDGDGDGGSAGDQPAPCYGPMETPNDVLFADHIYPIFQATCDQSMCHDEGSMTAIAFPPDDPAGAAAQIVSVVWNDPMMYIDPGSPDNSYLWHKLAGTHIEVGGSDFRMPFGGQLCTDDILLINKWIVQGAN
jgi:hypothetical protein